MSGESHAIPYCSVHGTRCQRDDENNWFCLECADNWLNSYVESKTRDISRGGVVLPTGVVDARRENSPSFRDLMPNRAARRGA